MPGAAAVLPMDNHTPHPPGAGTPCLLGQRAALEMLWARLDTLRGHAAAAGAGDVEGVHDLRVASRRVVAAMDLLARMTSREDRHPLREAVRAITRLLGRPRELDVMIGQLAALELPAGTPVDEARAFALAALTARRAAVAGRCAEAARAPHADAFRRAEAAFLAALRPGPECWLEQAARGLKRRHKRLRHAHRHWRGTGNDEDLHEVRIAFKKLRYACEGLAPHYGDPMRDFLRALKRTQDNLGHWNDCRVLADELATLRAPEADPAPPGLDTLIAVVAAQGDAARGAFEDEAADYFGGGAESGAKALFARPGAACCRESPGG